MVHPGHRAQGVLPGTFAVLPRVVGGSDSCAGRRRAERPLIARRIAAGVVWPVSGPPIEKGALLIGGDGRIEAVGPDALVPTPPDVPDIRLPGITVIPGLVNAHTHLELTGLRGQIEDPDFFDWIQHVRRAKQELNAEAFFDAACEGVREAWSLGVTTVADTGDSGAAARALGALKGRGVVYQEVFGPHPDQEAASFAALTSAVDRQRRDAPEQVRIGVSPHAPYTVSESLFRRVAAYARSEGLPLAIHLAESPAEVELVTQGTGPFADAWQSRGIPPFKLARSVIEYFDRLGVLGPDLLAIHAVQVDHHDVPVLAGSGAAVALCPRSNQRHGHGSPRIESMLGAGIRCGLGTDSAASVGLPDLIAEARTVIALARLSAEQAIRLTTIESARSIGLGDQVGALDCGKWADLCFFRGAMVSSSSALAVRLVSTMPVDIVGTCVAGRLVHGDWEQLSRAASPPSDRGAPVPQ